MGFFDFIAIHSITQDDKNKMIMSTMTKLIRNGKYNMYHKRSVQTFNRYLRRIGK